LSFTKLHKAQTQGLKSGEYGGYIYQDSSLKLLNYVNGSLKQWNGVCVVRQRSVLLKNTMKPALNGTWIEWNPVFSEKLSQSLGSLNL
jgi:hypothetical protein